MATLCVIFFIYMTTVSIAAEEPSVEHARDILHTALSLFWFRPVRACLSHPSSSRRNVQFVSNFVIFETTVEICSFFCQICWFAFIIRVISSLLKSQYKSQNHNLCLMEIKFVSLLFSNHSWSRAQRHFTNLTISTISNHYYFHILIFKPLILWLTLWLSADPFNRQTVTWSFLSSSFTLLPFCAGSEYMLFHQDSYIRWISRSWKFRWSGKFIFNIKQTKW